MNTNLMTSRRFAPLFWTQFLSAFNDNFLKNTLVFLILFQFSMAQSAALITLAGAVFMAPFLFFSALGGELADRFDKARMAEKLKLAEIAAAGVSVAGLALSSVLVLMAALFLFGVISALFGPIKYGILPDHLQKHELARANAWIEGATFIAILGGTIVGGLASIGGVNVIVFGPLMMALATACWWVSRYIPATGSAAPDLKIDVNIFRSSWRIVDELRQDKRIWTTGLMVSWFWLIGAIILSILPPMVKEVLGGSEIIVTRYLAIFAVALGAGSAVAAWMSAGRVVLLPTPVGTGVMALFGLDLAWSISSVETTIAATTVAQFFAGDNTLRIGVDLAGLAIAGAFLVVPSFTAIQTWAEENRRARVIAGVNVVSAAFMTLGGGIVAILQVQGVTVFQILTGLGVLNIIAAWLMMRHLPTNPFRDFVSILFRAFHGLEIVGLENIKKAGKAPILALNHVSFLDGALALALTDEDPVFVVDYTIAKAWWVRPFLRVCNFLALDPSKPMATRTLIKSVKSGKPLVIFPEGRITVTGGLMKIYNGAAMVADKTGSMVVPIRIDGLEKSYFSRLTSTHVRRRLFPKVKVTILEPVRLSVPDDLKGAARRSAAGADLYQIMSQLVFRTTTTDETILQRIIKTARERGMKKTCVEDPISGKLSYGRLLTGVSVLAEKFTTIFAEQTTLGVMLPNANGSIVTMLAVVSAGKTPAMINFSAGAANILSACKATQTKTILTSRAFVEQAKLDGVIDEVGEFIDIVWMDDIRQAINPIDKLFGFLRKTRPRVRKSADEAAVILFTSGSEGAPKGVVLSHRNILSNAAQAASRIDFHAGDKVFNVLPLFHSFGLTTGTILPLIAGVPVYFYPSPLHYRIIPELVYGSNATIIFGTDTFLSGYARTAHPYDFRSIRYCFAGAEPVKASTRKTYMEKFGLRILEGYGVTETAPIISINTPMYCKADTVGKIMPGMEARLEPVPGIDEGGRLFVRGPNVMAGYLRAENPGVVEGLEDGWHDTGDIVTIDAHGFIAIRGRAKRFAKIGGEMISLAVVEVMAGKVWPNQLCAVVAVVDARKGERLVLLTDAEGATRDDFVRFAKANGGQDLMIPAVVRVGEVPVLGSGKIDFVGVEKRVESEIEEMA